MRNWRSHTVILMILAWMGCVDKVDFDGRTPDDLPLIVEGHLSTDDTTRVFISRAYPVDGQYHTTPISSAKVRIVNLDDGKVWKLKLGSGGKQFGAMYLYDSIIPVTVGMRYQLLVFTNSGDTIESTPQVVQPSGTIERIYFEYVTGFNREKNVGENGFNVYVDATAPVDTNWHIRWNFHGTYKLRTDTDMCPGCNSVCYVSEREKSPLLARSQYVAGARTNRNFVKYIPINVQTFNDRYHIEIVQEVISRDSWEFYHSIRYQRENASSLFQPAFSSVKGNMYAVDSDAPVIGIFTAAQTTRKEFIIYNTDVPYRVKGTYPAGDCTQFPNSSLLQPPFWN